MPILLRSRSIQHRGKFGLLPLNAEERPELLRTQGGLLSPAVQSEGVTYDLWQILLSRTRTELVKSGLAPSPSLISPFANSCTVIVPFPSGSHSEKMKRICSSASSLPACFWYPICDVSFRENIHLVVSARCIYRTDQSDADSRIGSPLYCATSGSIGSLCFLPAPIRSFAVSSPS